ncbi:hypothetical protein BESB_067800 [Besnoitia besnoiti]|uniref:Uncharacterized protein n=1 Tax=Besnoitia besnoiti TaxID=94643 RepID=A0A2A9MGN1_BESBE|nr:hypothetical protein BESB_067800 [Besnoitia besnoiti]PFH34747.1 hypothetical protein BESB_067800 [Besnoitia besnoiti]
MAELSLVAKGLGESSRTSGKQQRAGKTRQRMYCASLLNKAVTLLEKFHPAAHTAETFAQECLKNETAEDAVFIEEVFYGVLVNAPFLKAAASALLRQRTTGTQKKEQWLYMVIIFLLVFKIDEIGYPLFSSFVRSCPALPMYLLLDFVFDEESLVSFARPEWLQHYDAAYVDHSLIPRLQKHAGPLAGLVQSLKTLSTAGAAVVASNAKVTPSSQGDSSSSVGRLIEGGRLSAILTDFGYSEKIDRHSASGYQNGEHQATSCPESTSQSLRTSHEPKPSTGKQKDLIFSHDSSGEKHAERVAISLPSPSLPLPLDCEEESAPAKTGASKTKKEAVSRSSQGAKTVQWHPADQFSGPARDDGCSSSPGSPQCLVGSYSEPLQETDQGKLAVSAAENGTAQKSRGDEKEDDEEDEDEDFWTKDVDGEEAFLGRKEERKRQKKGPLQAAFRQWTLSRPSTFQELVDEAEARFKEECTFRPSSRRKMPVFDKTKAPCEEYKMIKQYEIDKRDGRAFAEWQQKERKKEEEQRIKNIAAKRVVAQLARAQGIHAAALAGLHRARAVRSLREIASACERIRREQQAQEQAQLAEKARTAREMMRSLAATAKQAMEARREQVTEEKLKRTKEQARAMRFFTPYGAVRRTTLRPWSVRMVWVRQAGR